MDVKAEQIKDAIAILDMSIANAQTSNDERAAKAIEAMRNIRACADLRDFMNSFADAKSEDFEFNAKDEYEEAAMRYLTVRLNNPEYIRQLRALAEA
jgi:hypothetical protein